jgi:RelA/SpoT family (p)ppGpp synthetase
MRMDYQSIMAALLHDVIEDTGVEKSTIAEEFGSQVAELVDGVSKLTQIEFSSRAEAQAENFRKMVLAMVRDIRVIMVKLADRLHNMRTLEALDAERRKRIALETLEIYAPIANRLGMHAFRLELEDLGFAALYPRRYQILQAAVRKARRNRKEIISTIESSIKECLEKSELPPCAVWGREKHIYSIYKKMRDKRIPLSEIMDVYGFRIVVDSIDTCYRVLGAVHQLYKPLPERFNDYIAIPKANGYQSLHTTLFGPYGVPIELQIRTVDMDNMAEYGIAAHWLYKAGEHEVNTAQIRARQWLKSLLEMQQSAGNSLEFIENVKIDLFPDEVYVFTPKGRILELPRGATPVDFAYAIHSDIGDSCVAANIDRRLAPLSTPLSNGQTVTIITEAGARPNPAWLNFVVTGKARSNIRHFLKSQRRAESIAWGRQLLDNALATSNITWDQLPAEKQKIILDNYKSKSIDDLAEEIGLGNQMAQLIARRTAHAMTLKTEKESHAEAVHLIQPMAIKGTEGMIVNYAVCCRPIPGDHIVGIIQAGEGIIVHDDNCRTLRKLHIAQDHIISMQWDPHVKGDYKVDISLELINQRGMLAQVAGNISAAEADIDNIIVNEQSDQLCIVNLTLSVQGRVHLAKVLRRLRSIKAIKKIIRPR